MAFYTTKGSVSVDGYQTLLASLTSRDAVIFRPIRRLSKLH